MKYKKFNSIVIISSIPWHFSWQRHHDIAAGLAQRGYYVIYIDPLPKRWPNWREVRRLIGRLIGSSKLGGKFSQNIPDNVKIIAPLTLPDTTEVFEKVNSKLFLPFVAKKIRNLTGTDGSVLINYLPTHSGMVLQNLLEPDFQIYDCVVDWNHHPTATKTRIFEKEISSKADIVLVDSPILLEKMSKLKSNNVWQMLPGVHYDDFELCRQMSAIIGDNKKESIKCGYFGGISDDLDITLLAEISRRYSLKLIGPVSISKTLFSPSTEFIAPLPYKDLLTRLNDIDVLLLPYRRDKEHIKAVIPAKTFQCLATGKPTVVYGLPSLQSFNNAFYIAKDHEEFAHLIEIAPGNYLKSGKRQHALEIAQANDWNERITFIESLWSKE